MHMRWLGTNGSLARAATSGFEQFGAVRSFGVRTCEI